jgi:predicted alpha/beta hydrolase
LHRLPNPKSPHVVYFQHGVLDNAVTWVLHGPELGLAQIARDAGYDVFLGDFRGNYPRRQAEWAQKRSYWDGIGLEGYAYRDIPAFVKNIREVKRAEGLEDIKITYVGHSLGGETLMMYLIH